MQFMQSGSGHLSCLLCQAQCYTLHSTTVISEPSLDMMGTKQAAVFNVPGAETRGYLHQTGDN